MQAPVGDHPHFPPCADLALSVQVADFLSTREFHFIHFQDWKGNGFVALQRCRTLGLPGNPVVTTTVHGPEATAAVIAASDALFGQGDLTSLDAEVLRTALEELPHVEGAREMTVVEALVATGLVASLSEARRAIAQGGVSLDGIRVDDDGARVTGGLPGGVSVLRRGKKTLAGVFLGPRESA